MKTLSKILLPLVLLATSPAFADSQIACTAAGPFRPNRNTLVLEEAGGAYSYSLMHCLGFAHVPVEFPLCSALSEGALTYDASARVYFGENVRIQESEDSIYTLEDLRQNGISYDFDSCKTTPRTEIGQP